MFKFKTYESVKFFLGRSHFGFVVIILSACNSDKSKDGSELKFSGLSPDYIPPKISYEFPNTIDPNFKKLEPLLEEPYWISAMLMYAGERDVGQMLVAHDRLLKFSFPSEAPEYLPVTILGWAPANESMMVATREIFNGITSILDIKVEETEVAEGLNNFSVSQSIQVGVAGFSYFPNNFFEIGSDIFIAKNYSSPHFLSNGLTNYDYEVLLHELGHAMGLKHPFEGDRNNTLTLSINEDKTIFTAMSYNDDPSTFDGKFRPLDLMALTKLYGVNPEFNKADDIYGFNKNGGTFIIDGNGIDTIMAEDSTQNIFIDLRPGTHSHKGQKSNFITDSNQLTIAHGSELENVITGLGDDTIIGNYLDNKIISAAGDDNIFAGEGIDIVYPGSGRNIIDLSEDTQVIDKVILEKNEQNESFDIVYGFCQGAEGDIIDLASYRDIELMLLPNIDILDVPIGYIDNCIARVFGQNLFDAKILETQFDSMGSLQSLNISNNSAAIFITANSQSTGEIQNIYNVSNDGGSINVTHLMQLTGNYLDLDNWHSDNFIV